MQQANIINMITKKYEQQQKYRLGTVSKKITGGLKPVLRVPNLALTWALPSPEAEYPSKLWDYQASSFRIFKFLITDWSLGSWGEKMWAATV